MLTCLESHSCRGVLDTVYVDFTIINAIQLKVGLVYGA